MSHSPKYNNNNSSQKRTIPETSTQIDNHFNSKTRSVRSIKFRKRFAHKGSVQTVNTSKKTNTGSEAHSRDSWSSPQM